MCAMCICGTNEEKKKKKKETLKLSRIFETSKRLRRTERNYSKIDETKENFHRLFFFFFILASICIIYFNPRTHFGGRNHHRYPRCRGSHRISYRCVFQIIDSHLSSSLSLW